MIFPVLLIMTETHLVLESLLVSETSLGVLGKIQQNLALPSTKCVLLSLRQMFWLFIYASKMFFSQRLPLYNIIRNF